LARLFVMDSRSTLATAFLNYALPSPEDIDNKVGRLSKLSHEA